MSTKDYHSVSDLAVQEEDRSVTVHKLVKVG
jgi:hypothetical protein